MNEILLVKADSGTDIQKYVAAKLNEGFDLYGPLVTGHRMMLGQWMVQGYAYHEYRLVQAFNFSELERDVLSLQADGFDFFQFTSAWNSVLFQWMCRAKERDLRWVEGKHTQDVSAVYNVVERVEPTLHLLPNLIAGAPPLVVEGGRGRLVEFPSRPKNST